MKVKLGPKMRSLDFVLAFEPSLGHVEEENMINGEERKTHEYGHKPVAHRDSM